MTRFFVLTFCATFGLLSCGSSTPSENTATTTGTNTGTGTTATTGTKTSTSTTSTKGALELVLVDNDVPGWKVDRSANKGGTAQPMSGVTKLDVEGLIDGGASPFFNAPNIPKLFVWQNYINTTLPAAPDNALIYVYILEMPSAALAKGLYTAVASLSEYSRRSGTSEDWKAVTPSLGTESRIQDTSSQWWINFYQGVFYVEVVMSPSAGPAPDYLPSDIDLKNEAIKFARAIASKI